MGLFAFNSDHYEGDSLLALFRQFVEALLYPEREQQRDKQEEKEGEQQPTKAPEPVKQAREPNGKERTQESNMSRQGYPVLLAPTPGSGTVVQSLRHTKGAPWDRSNDCSSLPINNGSEALGESIVIDFTSPLFVGTFMLRVAGVVSHEDNATENYFDGKQRRFQAIVRGKFLREVPAAQCVTGQVFDHSPRRLPPLTKPFLRAVSAIAPHMEIDLYAKNPYVLSSLVATAKTLNQRQLSNENGTPEDVPLLDDPSALSGEKTTRSILLEEEAVFDTTQEYTFEFYQHMLDLANPHDFVLTFAGWSVRMGPTLDGQPIRILGAWQQEGEELQYIWSFDLLHDNHQRGSQ